ncbi:MAG TPA: hypothetical protein ENH82_04295 [bacterium]|nr:hypothetical protein [bacterium]
MKTTKEILEALRNTRNMLINVCPPMFKGDLAVLSVIEIADKILESEDTSKTFSPQVVKKLFTKLPE